jgi:N-acetylglutamate synthase-like GNAT family acetyltransferase
MKFLHVSNNYRKQGLGKKLFFLAAEKALELGAKKLYISATPSENTVDFYLNLGCVLATEVDEDLFRLEPEDIHLEFDLAQIGDESK